MHRPRAFIAGAPRLHGNPCKSVHFRHESEICHEIEDHVVLWALPIDARERCYLAKARYVKPVTRSFEHRYQTFTNEDSM